MPTFHVATSLEAHWRSLDSNCSNSKGTRFVLNLQYDNMMMCDRCWYCIDSKQTCLWSQFNRLQKSWEKLSKLHVTTVFFVCLSAWILMDPFIPCPKTPTSKGIWIIKFDAPTICGSQKEGWNDMRSPMWLPLASRMDLCSHFSQHQRGCNGSDEPRMDDSLFGLRKHYDDHLRAIKQSCLQCLNIIESEWKTMENSY